MGETKHDPRADSLLKGKAPLKPCLWGKQGHPPERHLTAAGKATQPHTGSLKVKTEGGVLKTTAKPVNVYAVVLL